MAQFRYPFYITGLPRSRTAWLSVAMSDWFQIACLHEPLARMPGFEVADLQSVLAACKTEYAGIADCGLPLAAPDLPAELPGPVLVVWREPEDVIDSLVGYMGGDRDMHAGGVALMHAALKEFTGRYDTMIVGFDDLENESAMREVWRHLTSGQLRFPRRRINALQRLRIDPVPNRLLEGLTHFAKGAIEVATSEEPRPVEATANDEDRQD